MPSSHWPASTTATSSCAAASSSRTIACFERRPEALDPVVAAVPVAQGLLDVAQRVDVVVDHEEERAGHVGTLPSYLVPIPPGIHLSHSGPAVRHESGRSSLGGQALVHDDDWLTARFEESRPRLHALAYRMLGSHAEADDAVQETWLRLRRNDPAEIENVGGLLTTVVGRVCLDRLRARRARPEDPVDDLATGGTADLDPTADPVDEALLAESVGTALMVVLDRLGPAERVAFVLHDVFGVPFDDVAEILGRSADSSRQLASRARRRLQGSAAADGRSTSCASATSSMRSCAPRAVATSTRSCASWIPTWCCCPTPRRWRWDHCGRRTARKRWQRAVGRCARRDARARRRRRRVRLGSRRSDPGRRAVHPPRRPDRVDRRHRRRGPRRRARHRHARP